MPITGLDGKALTVAVVQAELDALNLATRDRRARLRALLRVLEYEAQGQLALPLSDIRASDDETDLPPTLQPEADDGLYQGPGDDLPPGIEDRTPGAGA